MLTQHQPAVDRRGPTRHRLQDRQVPHVLLVAGAERLEGLDAVAEDRRAERPVPVGALDLG